MHCFAGTGVFSCQPILPDGAGEEAGLLTHGGSSAGKDWGRELQCVEFKKLMVHVRQEPTKLEFFLEREEFNLWGSESDIPVFEQDGASRRRDQRSGASLPRR